ncbi:MAG: ABC transporter ATP-binding protein [Clostridia bacterium]|nr:ABC transporter ATP-binding protein [Clostridia bacterium]
MTEFLRLDDVSFNYHSKQGETKALENVTLTVKEHEFFGIVGPSGSGKTTILSLIAGILSPNGGKITLLGKPVKEETGITGYMLQKDHLFEWRTIEQNVMLGLELKRDVTKESKDRVLNLLEKYGLIDFKDKYPGELSGGMRQRVALIRTLALSPKLLLLDEPFSALDYVTRLSVCNDVYRIIKNEKITTILISHDISEAISLCDRIAMLTERPAKVKKIFDVEIEGDSPLKKRESSSFSTMFEKVWKELGVQI